MGTPGEFHFCPFKLYIFAFPTQMTVPDVKIHTLGTAHFLVGRGHAKKAGLKGGGSARKILSVRGGHSKKLS